MGTQPRKFHPAKFRALLENKIHEKGYRGVNTFARENQLHRNAIARAVLGESRPTVESLDRWCRALECTPEERAEIIGSVYIGEQSYSGAA